MEWKWKKQISAAVSVKEIVFFSLSLLILSPFLASRIPVPLSLCLSVWFTFSFHRHDWFLTQAMNLRSRKSGWDEGKKENYTWFATSDAVVLDQKSGKRGKNGRRVCLSFKLLPERQLPCFSQKREERNSETVSSDKRRNTSRVRVAQSD